MTTADWHPPTASHRHIWLSSGRTLEVCARCPAARRRSHVARGYALVALGLGLLAAAGMLAGVSHSKGRFTLAKCAAPVHHARDIGAGC